MFCLVLFCLGWTSHAGHPGSRESRFQHISIKDGLSQNTVNCILQDDSGFMWFGTQDGLNRYDGYDFEIFKPDPDKQDSLSHNEIWCLYQDRAGVLWVGTRGGGLNRFNAFQKNFHFYIHQPGRSSSLHNNVVWCMLEDRLGRFWIGGEGGLLEMNRQTGTFKRFIKGYITCICEDRSGMLWMGTDGGGLLRFDTQTGRTGSYMKGEYIYSIVEDNAALWLGTSKGLYRFIPEGGELKRFPFPGVTGAGARTGQVNGMALFNSYGRPMLWLGTDGGGLYTFEPRSHVFSVYRAAPENPASISSNYIPALFKDRSGVVWVGTEGGGLNKLEAEKEAFGHYYHQPGNPTSLSGNSVWAIHEDTPDIIWVGTYSGLNRLDRRTGEVELFSHDPANPNSISSNRVTVVYQDRGGGLWVGTYKGLNRFDRSSGKFSHYLHLRGHGSSLSNNLVWTIRQDLEGQLWVGTFNGLNRLDTSTGAFSRYFADPSEPDGLSNNDVYIVYLDSQGQVWAGTNGGGLNLYHPDKDNFTRFLADKDKLGALSGNSIWSILEDREGTLWIGTNGAGLNRFDKKSASFQYFTAKDGLPNNVIYGILEDEEGYLWLSTNNGLSRFNPRTLEFKNYDVDDNIQSNEFNAGAYCKGAGGRLYFGGIGGFNVFLPGEILDNPYPPHMAITGVRIAGRPVEPSPGEEIRLTSTDTVFTIKVAALHYAASAKNRCAYKLEGLDADYIPLGARREVTFKNLKAGQYEFLVKGANSDGVWNPQPARLIVLVEPDSAGLLSWLAYPVILLLAVALLLLLIKAKKQPLRQEEPRVPGQKDATADDIMMEIFKARHISNREQEVIHLLIRGKSNREIADQLYISFYTAKNHIRNIYKKLGVNNRVALIHLLTKKQEHK